MQDSSASGSKEVGEQEIVNMPASNESDDEHHNMLPNQNPNLESAEAASDQAQVHAEAEEIDFRFKRGRDKPSDVRNALLTVAVLLAAATYQAVFNPPGGLWQEDRPDTNHVAGGVPPSAAQPPAVQLPREVTSTTAEIKQVAGVSILGTKNNKAYNLFILGNTVGFMLSMFTIEDLTGGFTHKLELNLAIGAICFTYGMCVRIITPSESQILTTSIVAIALACALVVRFRRRVVKWARRTPT